VGEKKNTGAHLCLTGAHPWNFQNKIYIYMYLFIHTYVCTLICIYMHPHPWVLQNLSKRIYMKSRFLKFFSLQVRTRFQVFELTMDRDSEVEISCRMFFLFERSLRTPGFECVYICTYLNTCVCMYEVFVFSSRTYDGKCILKFKISCAIGSWYKKKKKCTCAHTRKQIHTQPHTHTRSLTHSHAASCTNESWISVLWFVAVCCSMLQYAAVCRSAFQYVAVFIGFKIRISICMYTA